MIQFKKLHTGIFKAYINDADTEYKIIIANAYGCGRGKAYYDVYKGEDRVNNPMIRLNLYSAKQRVIAEILKNS
jgi:hypothetical protein